MVLIERSAVEDATEHGHVGECADRLRLAARAGRATAGVEERATAPGNATFPPAGVKDEQFLRRALNFFRDLPLILEYRSAGST